MQESTPGSNLPNADMEQQVPQAEVNHDAVRAAIGKLTIDSANEIVSSFHGSDRQYFARPYGSEDTINSIVTSTDEKGKRTNEVVGSGEDAATAMYDTWLNMRTLESVKTEPLMRMEVEEGVDVDFTNLEHYAPKVAPHVEAYKVPEHLEPLIEGKSQDRYTYDNTVKVEGWDKQVLDRVKRYAETETGSEVVKNLRIKSLSTLTPEQAVKLTLSMVHDLSKYSYDEHGKPGGTQQDEATTMQLLDEGFARKDDPTWEGNGVCRNISSNVKAVFEALKLNQVEMSMLRNTYVGYTGGTEDFTVSERQDAGIASSNDGHAWNTITTIDETGSASIAIVDVTWALRKTPEEALENMDHTQMRMISLAHDMFERSQDKQKSFVELQKYYESFTDNKHIQKYHRSERDQNNITKLLMNEYLTAAGEVLEVADQEFIEQGMPRAPGFVTEGAKLIKDNLMTSELTTLFRLREVGVVAPHEFNAILSGYIRGKDNIGYGDKGRKANSLVFGDDELQRQVLVSINDNAQIQEYAEASPSFRARVREFRPDLLPRFDPENNPADNKEIIDLARQNQIDGFWRMSNIGNITSAVNESMTMVAGGNQELIDRITGGRDLYYLVKNYKQIVEELSKASQIDLI